MNRAATTNPNPLAQLAASIPANVATAISIAARLAGAAAALFYAYDQDRLFPTEHFPRTWVFCVVTAVVAVASIAALARGVVKPGLATWLGAFGGGILVFAGANLAHKGPGVVVLVAGIVAWLSFAAAASQRREDPGAIVSGLFMGSLCSFLLVGICVLAVPN
ncbi:MAG: hypothetical protein ACKVVT_02590 [Dehalococcoidia bacterium]